MSAEWTDSNPYMDANDEWARSASHYRVKFRMNRHTMTSYFSMGVAHTKEPTAIDVLSCLASDSAGIDFHCFEEWSRNYGYDTDSRKAERTYRACEKAAANLRRFLGDEAYNELLYHVDSE